MNQTLQTIAQRSSIRAYRKDKLSKEQLDALVNAALQAPTARNEQEVHITVVDGNNPILAEIEEEKRRIFALEAGSEEEKNQILNSPHNSYYEAPTVFIFSVRKDFMWNKVDAGIAVENVHLAAKSLGLGSLIIGSIKKALDGDKKDYFAQALDFPENYEFAIALSAGYPDIEKAPHQYDSKQQVSYL